MKARLINLHGLFSLTVYSLLLLNPNQSLDDERLIEGAKKEQELVVYSGMTIADATALLQAFEKKYPFIRARQQRSSGGKLIAQIQTEHRTRNYIWDVYAQAGLEGYVQVNHRHQSVPPPAERKFFPEGHKDTEG